MSGSTLAYQDGNAVATLLHADGSGASPALQQEGAYAFPRYSPDGTRIALTVLTGSASDIWLAEPASGVLTRLTSGGVLNERAEWSPDGSRVLYRTVRGARSSIWWQPADGSGMATPLLANDGEEIFEGVLTPDGRNIVYQRDTAGSDVLTRPIEGAAASRPIVNTRAVELHARPSPDGKWVAFTTDETGSSEVVVQAFDGSGGRVQVSLRGGDEPVWSRDGRRLFYRGEGKFKVAEVSGAPTFHVISRADFMGDEYIPAPAPHANYDVSPDGRKLLVLKAGQVRLVVVHGWDADFRAHLSGTRNR
jgi:serine/threonine-protein kinase